MLNANTKVIFRYRTEGGFYSSITTTLEYVAENGASELATRIDSEILEAGITWTMQVGTITVASDEVTTGEPYENLDYAFFMLDAVAQTACGSH